MDEILFKMQGNSSELCVYENRIIVIDKKSSERKSIYQYANIKDVAEVLIIPAGENTGCIKFVLCKDDSEVCFNIKKRNAKEENLKAFEIKAFVEEKIALEDNRDSIIPIREFRNLFILFKEGILTQEEFAEKKKQLLGL